MKAEPIAPKCGRLFGARAAAEYLGISVHKARRLIASGELVAMRTTAGRFEGVYEQDCDAWIAAHRRAVEPVAPRPSIDERIAHLLPTERRFA